MMTDSPTPSTSKHHDDKCDKPEKSDKTVLLVTEVNYLNFPFSHVLLISTMNNSRSL